MQVFREDGAVVPVTRVQAGPCVVTQLKTKERDKVQSVQVGFDKQKLFRLKKPQKGHLKDINVDGDKNVTVRFLHDFKSDNKLKCGDRFTVNIFEPGEKVQVTGTSKGKGFQGVVKRHGFHGSPASHGHKDQLRMPGSIGATDAARVFKGTRMGGHMGDARVTIKNLEIVEINADENELLVKGAVPGARNGLLYIFTDKGKIEIDDEVEDKIETKETEVESEKAESKKDSETIEQKKEKIEEKKINKKDEEDNKDSLKE